LTGYFISGLGADRRIFQKLRLPAKLKIIHLNWIRPHKHETIPAYARRFASQVDTSEDFILIGISFGGMVATELSQILQPKKTIIISSAGCKYELPGYFRWAGSFRVHYLVNSFLMKSLTPFTCWIFGTRGKEERLLLRQIMMDTDAAFLKWAIESILTWKRIEKPSHIFHIHGSADRILPLRYVKADNVVQEGGHLMVFSLAEEISKILSDKMDAG
jgi:pimeloyl-ACP methyl ester carboxylesterase